jgi:hypothetical protein
MVVQVETSDILERRTAASTPGRGFDIFDSFWGTGSNENTAGRCCAICINNRRRLEIVTQDLISVDHFNF